jgi:hypothetical protein
MFLRFLAVIGLAWAVSGCVTTNQHSLSASDVRSFKLAEVRVNVPIETSVTWYDAVQEYAQVKAIPNFELNDATDNDEFKRWIRDRLAVRVKEAMQQHVSGILNGTRPVRLEVLVRRFEISSAIQRIVVGGGYSVAGDVNLVDAKTGAVLASYPGLVYARMAGNGIGGTLVQAAFDASNPPATALVNGFAETYRDWLQIK